MPVPTRCAAGCTALVVAAALAGCTSSSGNAPSPTAAPTTPPATSTPAGTASTPPPATQRAIAHAFEVFFNTNTSLADSIKVLQHGPAFRQALIKESNSPSANKITAKVRRVTLSNPNVANVTYSLYSAGSPLLPSSAGSAVRENGRWKVAARTFCALLAIEGGAPAACKNKSITALPG